MTAAARILPASTFTDPDEGLEAAQRTYGSPVLSDLWETYENLHPRAWTSLVRRLRLRRSK